MEIDCQRFYINIYFFKLLPNLKGSLLFKFKNMLAIRRLQNHNLNRHYRPFNLRAHSLRYAFSTVLSDGAQQAFIAHTAIQIIRYFKRESYLRDTRSIRNLILDRAYFKSILINMFHPSDKNGLKKEEITSQWIDSVFQQNNYQAVLQAFQLSCGASYNQEIWLLNEKKGEKEERKSLFPVSMTQPYYQKLGEGHNGILSGMKGIGKTFSLFTYSYLSSFKIKYFARNQISKNELLLYGEPLDWAVVTQVCYITLNIASKYEDYLKQISHQFQNLYPWEQIERDYLEDELKQSGQQGERLKIISNNKEIQIIQKNNPQNEEQKQYKNMKRLKLLAQRLNMRAQKHGIKLVCVIDEASLIFDSLRKLQAFLKENGLESQWKSTQQFKALQFYHSLFSIFLQQSFRPFYRLILSSSGDFQFKNAQDARKSIFGSLLNQLPILKVLCTQRIFGTPVSMPSQLMSRKQGLIQFYNIFWFEIQSYLSRKRILGTQIKIYKELDLKLVRHRAIFQDQFGIRKEMKFQMIQQWKNEVHHRFIGQFLSLFESQANVSVSFFCPEDNIFLVENPTKQQQAQFRGDLRKLKQNIEQARKDQIVKSIANYISQAANEQEGSKRIQQIYQLLWQAQQLYLNKNELNSIKNSYWLNLTPLQQTALVKSIKIGYFRNKELQFGMSHQNVVQLLSSAIRNRNINIEAVRLNKSRILSSQFNFVNMKRSSCFGIFSYQIFSDGYFNFNYTQYQGIGQFNGFKVRLSVGQTCPIFGSWYSYIDVFENILRLADEKVDQLGYVGGFPGRLTNNIHYQKDKKRDQSAGKRERSFIPLEGNLLFNNMICKKLKSAQQGQNAQYDIILYDWTLRQLINRTIKETLNKITKYLAESNIKGNVNCKLIIMAPDFLMKEQFDQWIRDGSIVAKRLRRRNSCRLRRRNSCLKQNIADLYHSFSFKDEIQGVSFQRNLTVRLASFGENSPFQLNNNSPNSVLIDFFTECYKKQIHQKGTKKG